MSGITIIFQGEPVAQQRCRIFKRGNRVCSFDPQTMYKKGLKQQAEDQIHGYEEDRGKWAQPTYPRIYFLFLMPIPKSMSKKERSLAETGTLKHIKKPDVDNLIKLYLDVLTGSVIQDDNSVQIAHAIKLYSMTPKTVIFIEETDKVATNKELYGGS